MSEGPSALKTLQSIRVLSAALALKGQKAGASVKLQEFPRIGILWMFKINNGGGERK